MQIMSHFFFSEKNDQESRRVIERRMYLYAEPLEVYGDELVAAHDGFGGLRPGLGVQRAAVGARGVVRRLRGERGGAGRGNTLVEQQLVNPTNTASVHLVMG